MDTQNDGLGKVTPFKKNDNFCYRHVRFLGCNHVFMILVGLIQISKNGSPKVEFEVSKVSFNS